MMDDESWSSGLMEGITKTESEDSTTEIVLPDSTSPEGQVVVTSTVDANDHR